MGSNGCMGARLTLAMVLIVGVLSSAASGQVTVPRKTKHSEPVYPRESLRIGDEGAVLLELSVQGSGIVEDARVLWSGCERLNKAALATAKQWRYEQIRINGRPQPHKVVTTVSFKRPKRPKRRAPLAEACKWIEPPKPTR
jgi:TonB family protein